jgi:hypothetical protein
MTIFLDINFRQIHTPISGCRWRRLPIKGIFKYAKAADKKCFPVPGLDTSTHTNQSCQAAGFTPILTF